MACIGNSMPPDVRARFKGFLSRDCSERIFTSPLSSPGSTTNGFCYVGMPWLSRCGFYARTALLNVLLALPFDGLTVRYLRLLGATIGEGVAISPGVWIDPMYPELLTIEDDVLIGAGAKITMHEFDIGEFRAGRVVIRKGALVGAFSIIGCGVEIGERATVAGGAVVRRDVPGGAAAIGNPARVLRKRPSTEAGR